MNKKPSITDDPAALRRSAEQRLAERPDSKTTLGDEKRLLHELQVHQIELEMLNENLRQAQAELEKSWACYYDLYELAPVGYLTVNNRDIIRNANLTATTMLSSTRKSLLKLPLTQFIMAADQDQYYLHRTQLVETGISQTCEVRVGQQNGESFWVRMEMNCLVEADGAQLFRVVLIDISDRKQAEKRLIDADLQKDVFLAMLGHELRNPLAAINNAAEILITNSLNKADHKSMCKVLTRNVYHISRMVNDLLDVSRITHGLISIQMECIDLIPVLRESVEAVHTLIDTKHQTLDLQLPETPIYLTGDHVRLVQVFSNLVNNAAKYTGEGGHIELKTEVEGQSVIILIRDNGMGIAPEFLPRIFDIFAQSERSLARSEGGLGIGLTLVKKLLELHAGSITVNSQGVGQGSSFTVRLPIMIEKDKQSHKLSKDNYYAENVGPGLRVLIIDDNRDVVDSLSLMLEEWGHQVRTAFSGMNGLAAAKDFRPEVVLVDIGLPDMHGFEVTKKLRAQSCNSRALIIIISGYGSAHNPHQVEATAVDHYLTKPPNICELRNLIIDFQHSNQILSSSKP